MERSKVALLPAAVEGAARLDGWDVFHGPGPVSIDLLLDIEPVAGLWT